MRNTSQDGGVIVTGAARGIGFGVAQALISAGRRVFLIDINADAVEQAADELGDRAIAYAADLSREVEVRDVVQRVFRDASSVYGLVNNAGIVMNAAAEDTSYADFETVMAANLSTMFLCAREVGKHLIGEGLPGSIVNTASMCARIVVQPQKQMSYNVSKSAALGLTRSLAVEWAPFGIRVNSVSPGYVRTPLTESEQLAPLRDEWESRIPLGRLAHVDDITGPFLFLLSDDARYVTGHDLVVDGGYSLW